MYWKKATLLIITNDDILVETLGGKLQKWGAVVFHIDVESGSALPAALIDVVLVDIRQNTDKALQQLNNIVEELPTVETILINSSDNISASMMGMRAGAGDELIVPFDTDTLRQKINAAGKRSRKRLKQRRSSLFTVFGEAMNAATFAQAGEFETALDFVNRSAGKDKTNDGATTKKSNPKR